MLSDCNLGSFGNFFAGTAAGGCNAVILNPISAVKYRIWRREQNRGIFREVTAMYQKGRLHPFVNGLLPTILRDVVFGGCYTSLRLQAQQNEVQPDMANLGAAAVATVASGPLNLARNLQYATKSRQRRRSITSIMRGLIRKVNDRKTFQGKLQVLQQRLRIGWGTARVAVGIAFGQKVYDECMKGLHYFSPELNQ